MPGTRTDIVTNKRICSTITNSWFPDSTSYWALAQTKRNPLLISQDFVYARPGMCIKCVNSWMVTNIPAYRIYCVTFRDTVEKLNVMFNHSSMVNFIGKMLIWQFPMVPAHRGIFQQKESRIFSPIDIWLVFYQTATDRCSLFLSAFYNQAKTWVHLC